MPPDDTHRASPAAPHEAPHEQGRADFYALIGALLLGPPDAGLLEDLADAPLLPGPEPTPLGQAWQRLMLSAHLSSAERVADEFAALFLGVGSPRVDPHGSRYRAGFLMDKPLAELRGELRALGLARRDAAAETEDHLGALCETMRLLIGGAAGLRRQPLALQQRFFESQIAPWYAACLADLRRAEGADFYAVLADFAQAFFETEAQAFDIGDAPHEAEPPGAEPVHQQPMPQQPRETPHAPPS
jgi:TorA maturation chaperone TorD